ncbi:hypothetical protein [Kutzneria sp. NPDC052558]|uniref:hypothetical protein n=1 Tax=Kutzneria sp. NPDC052558 TaxID=3364121 RepID=UPI0037C7AC11
MRAKKVAMLTLAALVGLAAPAAANPGDAPLKNGKPLIGDPPPLSGTGYTFATTAPLWSVVAVRPSPGRDVDLDLYADGTTGPSLATSDQNAGLPDFIAIDSSKVAPAAYRTVVTPYGGSAPYTLTWTAPAQSEQLGYLQYAVGNDENMRATDVDIKAGQCTAFFVFGTTHNTGSFFVYRGAAGDPAIVTAKTPPLQKVNFKPGDKTDYYDPVAWHYKPTVRSHFLMLVVNQHDTSDSNPLEYAIQPADPSFCA